MSFDAERLASIERLEPGHFWFAGRRVLVDRLLPADLAGEAPVLDVGCGTASLAGRLAERGQRVIGLDRRPEGIERAARAGHPNASFVLGDALKLPFRSGVFGGALALDVLEHVDDARLVRELARVLAPGAWLLVTVPAVPALWSLRDEAAGHLRRYTRRSLRAVLENGGFCVERLRAYQFALLPVVAASRLVGRFTLQSRAAEDRPPAVVNRVLRCLNVAEARLDVDWPIGSSLAALARVRA
jgi:SAM-dependent methyltransferase